MLSSGKIMKHVRDVSGESLERVPEEYIHHSKKNSDLISLDESQFFNHDDEEEKEGEDTDLDFSPT
jgi:hypothetical protein